MGAPDDDDTRASIDREAILARRRRFVAAALTGLTTSTLATACPCLKVAPSEAPPQPDGAENAREDDGDAAEEVSPDDGGSREAGEGAAEGAPPEDEDAAASAEAGGAG